MKARGGQQCWWHPRTPGVIRRLSTPGRVPCEMGCRVQTRTWYPIKSNLTQLGEETSVYIAVYHAPDRSRSQSRQPWATKATTTPDRGVLELLHQTKQVSLRRAPLAPHPYPARIPDFLLTGMRLQPIMEREHHHPLHLYVPRALHPTSSRPQRLFLFARSPMQAVLAHRGHKHSSTTGKLEESHQSKQAYDERGSTRAGGKGDAFNAAR